jgi:ATP-dependent helicase IRC3
VIELLGKGFIRIEQLDTENTENCFAYFTPAASKEHIAAGYPLYLTRRQILTAETLCDAVRGCDTYIGNKLFPAASSSSLRRNAPWRQKPASDAQKTLVSKRWSKIYPGMEDERRTEMLENLTKGEAADIITRLRHGSQERFKKKLKQAAKEMHEMNKEQSRRAREDVKVGLLEV